MILLNEYPKLKQELINHVNDLVADGVLTEENKDDWHFHAFNETPYVIGRFQAKEWLKKHNIDPFKAIAHCITWEQEEFGCTDAKRYVEPEHVVNMLTFTLGYQILMD